MNLTKIEAGPATMVLAPALGGGIARLDVDDRPILRPWSGNETDLFSLALNILTPFSNRISNGGFEWNGKFFSLSPNVKGEPYPIHGDGFQRAWQVETSGNTAEMYLPKGVFGPWRYSAKQKLVLAPDHLTIEIAVTNRADRSLPYGVGFHPWFPRSARTQLSFFAETVWLEDKTHLPVEEVHLAAKPEWQFSNLRTLPTGWINNCFSGWDGVARIEHDESFTSCTITCSHTLEHVIVYSPSAKADYFCLEPVSHPVDAFNRSKNRGLVDLAPQNTLTANMRFRW